MMKSTLRSSISTLTLALILIGAAGCAAPAGGLSDARTALRASDYDRAVELVDAALIDNPNDLNALLLRANILRQQAEASPSMERRHAILRDFSQTLARAEGIDPTDARFELERLVVMEGEMQRGSSAFQEGQQGDESGYVRAAGHFEAAHLVAPDTESIAALYQGLSLIAAGTPERAISPLRTAIERGEENTDAYVYLSRIYLQEDRPSDAVAVMEMAAQRFPDDEDLQTEILNTYVRAGQPERARDAYAEAVLRTPDDATVRYSYGSLLLDQGEVDGAIMHLERAAQLDPNNANIQFNLGAAYQNKAAAISRELQDITTVNEETRRMGAERDAYLQRSVGPLEASRRLTVEMGQSPEAVCDALFRVYTQLNRARDAEEAAVCAGHAMN